MMSWVFNNLSYYDLWGAFKGAYDKCTRLIAENVVLKRILSVLYKTHEPISSGDNQSTTERYRDVVQNGGAKRIRKPRLGIRTKKSQYYRNNSGYDSPRSNTSDKCENRLDHKRHQDEELQNLVIEKQNRKYTESKYDNSTSVMEDKGVQVHIVGEHKTYFNCKHEKQHSLTELRGSEEDFSENSMQELQNSDENLKVKIIAGKEIFEVSICNSSGEFSSCEKNLYESREMLKRLEHENQLDKVLLNEQISCKHKLVDDIITSSDESNGQAKGSEIGLCEKGLHTVADNICLRCAILDCEKNTLMNELGDSLEKLNKRVKELKKISKECLKTNCLQRTTDIVETGTNLRLNDKSNCENTVIGREEIIYEEQLRQQLQTRIFERDELAEKLKEICLKYNSLSSEKSSIQKIFAETRKKLDMCINERDELARALEKTKLQEGSLTFHNDGVQTICNENECCKCALLSKKQEELWAWLEHKFKSIELILSHSDCLTKELKKLKENYLVNKTMQTADDRTFCDKSTSPIYKDLANIITTAQNAEELSTSMCTTSEETEFKSEGLSFSNAGTQINGNSIINEACVCTYNENKLPESKFEQTSRYVDKEILERGDSATIHFPENLVSESSTKAPSGEKLFNDCGLLADEKLSEWKFVVEPKETTAAISDRHQLNRKFIGRRYEVFTEIGRHETKLTDDQLKKSNGGVKCEQTSEKRSFCYSEITASGTNSQVLAVYDKRLPASTDPQVQIGQLECWNSAYQNTENLELCNTSIEMSHGLNLDCRNTKGTFEGKRTHKVNVMPFYSRMPSGMLMLFKTFAIEARDFTVEINNKHGNKLSLVLRASCVPTLEIIWLGQKLRTGGTVGGERGHKMLEHSNNDAAAENYITKIKEINTLEYAELNILPVKNGCLKIHLVSIEEQDARTLSDSCITDEYQTYIRNKSQVAGSSGTVGAEREHNMLEEPEQFNNDAAAENNITEIKETNTLEDAELNILTVKNGSSEIDLVSIQEREQEQNAITLSDDCRIDENPTYIQKKLQVVGYSGTVYNSNSVRDSTISEGSTVSENFATYNLRKEHSETNMASLANKNESKISCVTDTSGIVNQLVSAITAREVFKKQVKPLKNALRMTEKQLEEQTLYINKMRRKRDEMKKTISEQRGLMKEYERLLASRDIEAGVCARSLLEHRTEAYRAVLDEMAAYQRHECRLRAQRDGLRKRLARDMASGRQLAARVHHLQGRLDIVLDSLRYRDTEVESLREQVAILIALLEGRTTRWPAEESRGRNRSVSMPSPARTRHDFNKRRRNKIAEEAKVKYASYGLMPIEDYSALLSDEVVYVV